MGEGEGWEALKVQKKNNFFCNFFFCLFFIFMQLHHKNVFSFLFFFRGRPTWLSYLKDKNLTKIKSGNEKKKNFFKYFLHFSFTYSEFLFLFICVFSYLNIGFNRIKVNYNLCKFIRLQKRCTYDTRNWEKVGLDPTITFI